MSTNEIEILLPIVRLLARSYANEFRNRSTKASSLPTQHHCKSEVENA